MLTYQYLFFRKSQIEKFREVKERTLLHFFMYLSVVVIFAICQLCYSAFGLLFCRTEKFQDHLLFPFCHNKPLSLVQRMGKSCFSTMYIRTGKYNACFGALIERDSVETLHL